MKYETLLLTGTVVPSIDIKKMGYNSTSLLASDRFLQYYNSLIYYITQSNFKFIVFCDNSDYRFKKEHKDILMKLSNIYSKGLEIISFKGNVLSQELGYGYGEQEIIDYAYKNSKILKNSESRFKITGRYVIGNINNVIKVHENYNNLFFRNIPAFYAVNTAFFKVENSFYSKYLYGCGLKCSYSNGINLESVYYGILKNIKVNFEKVKILPYRINSDNDYMNSIHKYNVVKRSIFWYDKLLLKFGFYNL